MTYNSTTEAFAIRAMCSNNGNGSALTVRTYENTINPDTGYVDKNLILFGYDTVLATWQNWLIVPLGGTSYKIVSCADPNLALTSYGTGNGTASGTTSTSEGNVFVSEFTGADNQLWEIESGGSRVNTEVLSPNIKTVASTTTRTVAVGNTATAYNCPVTEFGHSVVWSSSNTAVATVDANGRVSPLMIGEAIISATVKDANGATYATYSSALTVYFPSGQYFLYNYEYDNYMQIDNDAVPTTNGATLELWDFDGALDQKWNIVYLGNQYYKITSVASGLALSVPEASISQDGAGLAQEAYTGSPRQQWKIIRTSDGTYKFATRSQETLYLAAGEGDFSSGGRNIEQRYDLSDQAEEWIICVDTSVLLAIADSDTYNRHEYFSETKSILQTEKEGKVSVTKTALYFKLGISGMINYLKSSNIFIVHTHGTQTGFKIANSGTTFINMNDIAGEDLSNISFALLLTCDTALNYDPDHITNNTPVNIIEQMVICGARTVVGFKEETLVYDCNKFAKDITRKLIEEGLSVEDAINNINYEGYVKNMREIAEIAGDRNNKLR